MPVTLPLALILIAGGPPQQVATLRELGPALTACFRAPEHSAGSQITVRFSLDRSGAVLGRPQVTYSKLVGTLEQKRAFVEAALDSLRRCTPVHLTPGLGGALAGRPLSVRFIGGGPALSI